MGERNFYLGWATVIPSLCHSHTNLILTYIASLINMWYFSHLSVIVHLPLSPLLDWELLRARTRFQDLPSARHIRSCSVKCLLKEMWWVCKQWWQYSWSPYREQPLTHFACLSWLNPHENLMRNPRQSRGLMTCLRSPAVEWQGWDWSPGLPPSAAHVFSTSASSLHRAPGLSSWACKLSLYKKDQKCLGNSTYAFRISLITSFTKLFFVFFSLSLQVYIQTREAPYLRSQRIGHKYRISWKVQ